MRTYNAYKEKSTSDTVTITASATARDNTATLVKKVDGETVTGGISISWAGTSDLSKVIAFEFTKGDETTTYTVNLTCHYTGS